MTNSAKWPLYENYSMTNSAKWLTNFTQWPPGGNAGCRLGVGLGVGIAGLQVPEYQHNKSRVSRVQDMFYPIYTRAPVLLIKSSYFYVYTEAYSNTRLSVGCSYQSVALV